MSWRTSQPEPQRDSRRPARASLLVRNGVSHDARVLRAAKVLCEEGFEVMIVGSVTAESPLRRERLAGLDVVRMRARSPIGLLSRFTRGRLPPGAAAVHRTFTSLDWNRRALLALLKFRPVLVHANDYNTMWPALAARRLLGARVVYDSHELWPDRNGRPEWRRWLLASESRFVRAADAVITASPGYAEVLSARYGIPRPAIVRNIPDCRPVPVSASHRSAGPPVIAYAGGLMPGRGLEVAIRALAMVPNARLRLTGTGRTDYLARLRAVAEAAGVAERVEFAGGVSADVLVEHLSQATIGLALIEPVCLSYELTLPNKLFEYAVAGLPVVGSEVQYVASMLREWDIGEVADPSDPRAVADAYKRLLDPGRHGGCVANLRPFLRRFSWRGEARELAATYREVTSGLG